MMRMIECLEHPLHIDEVREGLPEIGWTVFSESVDYAGGAVPGAQPGYYRVLVADSDDGMMRLFGFFSPEDGVLQGVEYTKFIDDELEPAAAVGVPIANSPNTIFSPELATRLIAYVEDRLLAYLKEGASDIWEAREEALILARSWEPDDE